MLAPTKKQQTAQTTSIPAPVKGLNARDAIASMPPDFALVLDNCFCSPTTVDSRNGSSNWVTGITGWVETITHYSSPTNGVLIAAANNSIYDVTALGSVGSAKISGLTNNRWQTANFATPGGNYLYMVNGADNPVLYDGTNYTQITQMSSPIAITGVDPSTFIQVCPFQSRLWFIPVNSLTPYYLPVSSIGGAAAAFPLGSIFQLGGYIMAMATWTIDNVSGGIQDYAVFVTSEGEVAIYQGYDPSFAATFTLVGIFRIGRPVGRRCFTKIASDNAIICSDGLVSFSKELTTDRDQSQAFSYNIQKLINSDISSYRGNFGWQVVYYPAGNKLMINVPATENIIQYQYVMNTITGAWSTWNFENNAFNAACWDVFEDVLYFGTNGAVVIADTGTSDNGNAIQWDIKPAFNYFGALGQQKYFTFVRPIIAAAGQVMLSYVLDLDYANTEPIAPPLSESTVAPWNTSPWNTTPWGGTPQITKNWLSVGGIGYAASLRIKGNTKGMIVSLQSTDYVYERGGVL
jgi:hypothetical protein